jgi:hypothetical protein
MGKEAFPSVLCPDLQSRSAGVLEFNSVKGEYQGLATSKRVNGRKRLMVADAQGRW